MTVTEAAGERDRVLDEVVAKMLARGTFSPGIQVIERWARAGREFSLNAIRDELAVVGIDGQFAPGGLVQAAIKAGLIVKLREETSDLLSTNHKKIGVYIGRQMTVAAPREAVTVPVVRDPAGRFSTPCDDDQPALFEVSA